MNVTNAELKTILAESSIPVVVYFWATWCQPCKMSAKYYAEVAQELDGAVKLVKIDIEENMNSADEYNIKAVPTLLLYKNNNVISRETGGFNTDTLKVFIQGGLKNAA